MSQTKAELVNGLSVNAALADAITVDSSGEVGIGDTSPDRELVVKNASSNATIKIEASNAHTSQLFFSDTDTENVARISVFHGSGADQNSMIFGTAGSSRLAITSAGNVGIGTISPSQQLTLVSSGDSKINIRGHGSSTGYFLGMPDATNAQVWNAENGYIQIASNDTERIRVHSTGEVSIATTSTNLQGGGASDFYLTLLANTGSNHNGMMISGVANQHAAHTTRPSGNHLYFAGFFLNNAGSGVGNIEVGLSGTSFHTSSDYRLKENVTNISDGITRLKKLLPKRFNFISDETNTLQDGFLAHEVSSIVPEAISGEKDAVATEDGGQFAKGDPIYQQIDHSKLVPLLTAALQEEIAKREALESRVATLEAA